MATPIVASARRSFLKLFPGVAAAIAAAPATAAMPSARTTEAPEPHSAPPSPQCPAPRAKPDYSTMWPGRDPDPIPVGTRCLYNYGGGELREVVVVAGPINPEPGNWDEPIGWYMIEGPWIDESYARMDARSRVRIANNNHRMARLTAFMRRTDDVARKRDARALISKLGSSNAIEHMMIGRNPAFATHRRSLTMIV